MVILEPGLSPGLWGLRNRQPGDSAVKLLHYKNIRRIYDRIAGNLLPGYVPVFLREPVKIISHGMIGKSKVVFLTAA